MDTRPVHPMKAAGIYLAIASLLMLTGVGCDFCFICQLADRDPEPEDLATIAAVLNKTAGPLTVTFGDPATTDVLEPDEAIFYALTQSRTAREFDFQSGESTAHGSLLLLSTDRPLYFDTGFLTVRLDEADETLTVVSHFDDLAPFTLARSGVRAGSSIFVLVNATSERIALRKAGASLSLSPDEHTTIVLWRESDVLAVAIRTEDQPDSPELVHVFEGPTSEDGEVSAFIVFITLQGDAFDVETQRARFRQLE